MTRKTLPLSLENILLGFIAEQPTHGYDLYKKMTGMGGIALIWHVKQSQLYALLEKLETRGLLSSTLLPGESYLLRKEFALTSSGMQQYTTWVSSPVEHGRDMRQEFLAKLFFAQKGDPRVFGGLLLKQRQSCLRWLDNLERKFNAIDESQIYERMILQYRITQTRAMIDWLETYSPQTIQPAD